MLNTNAHSALAGSGLAQGLEVLVEHSGEVRGEAGALGVGVGAEGSFELDVLDLAGDGLDAGSAGEVGGGEADGALGGGLLLDDDVEGAVGLGGRSTRSTPLRELMACLIWPAMAPVESSPATVRRTWMRPAGRVPLAGQVSRCLLGSLRTATSRAWSWALVSLLRPTATKSVADTLRVCWTSGVQTGGGGALAACFWPCAAAGVAVVVAGVAVWANAWAM